MKPVIHNTLPKVFVLFTALLITSGIFAQDLDNEKRKKVLSQLLITELAWGHRNSSFYPPADYITDATGKITGQRFLAYNDRQFKVIDITGFPDKIKISNEEASVKMSGDNIAYIKSEALYLFEFNITANDKGQVVQLTNPGNPNEHLRNIKVDYTPEGKVSLISFGNGKSVSFQKLFIYEGQKVTCRNLIFKPGKGPNPKAITEEFTSVYDQDGKRYILTESHLGKKILEYNEAGTILRRQDEKKDGSIEDSEYTYVGDKIFKGVTVIKKGGVLTSKEIGIFFARTDLPETLPYYERVPGRYVFNGSGELVWEQNDRMMYREKVNGVWSEWKAMGR